MAVATSGQKTGLIDAQGRLALRIMGYKDTAWLNGRGKLSGP